MHAYALHPTYERNLRASLAARMNAKGDGRRGVVLIAGAVRGARRRSGAAGSVCHDNPSSAVVERRVRTAVVSDVDRRRRLQERSTTRPHPMC